MLALQFCGCLISYEDFDVQVYVLKPSHKSEVQPKVVESPASESMAALLPTNASRDVEPDSETAPDVKMREIVMDNGERATLVRKLNQVVFGNRKAWWLLRTT